MARNSRILALACTLVADFAALAGVFVLVALFPPTTTGCVLFGAANAFLFYTPLFLARTLCGREPFPRRLWLVLGGLVLASLILIGGIIGALFFFSDPQEPELEIDCWLAGFGFVASLIHLGLLVRHVRSRTADRPPFEPAASQFLIVLMWMLVPIPSLAVTAFNAGRASGPPRNNFEGWVPVWGGFRYYGAVFADWQNGSRKNAVSNLLTGTAILVVTACIFGAILALL